MEASTSAPRASSCPQQRAQTIAPARTAHQFMEASTSAPSASPCPQRRTQTTAPVRLQRISSWKQALPHRVRRHARNNTRKRQCSHTQHVSFMEASAFTSRVSSCPQQRTQTTAHTRSASVHGGKRFRRAYAAMPTTTRANDSARARSASVHGSKRFRHARAAMPATTCANDSAGALGASVH